LRKSKDWGEGDADNVHCDLILYDNAHVLTSDICDLGSNESFVCSGTGTCGPLDGGAQGMRVRWRSTGWMATSPTRAREVRRALRPSSGSPKNRFEEANGEHEEKMWKIRHGSCVVVVVVVS
jgi:hypothetical protein